jgi:hypothetical protein
LIEISDSEEEMGASDDECEVIALPSSSEDEETESTARVTGTLEKEMEGDPAEDGEKVAETRKLGQQENEKIHSDDILNVSPSKIQLKEFEIPLRAVNPSTIQEESQEVKEPEETQTFIDWENYERLFSDNYTWYLVERLLGGKRILEIHVEDLTTKKFERLNFPSEYVQRIQQYMKDEDEGLVEDQLRI